MNKRTFRPEKLDFRMMGMTLVFVVFFFAAMEIILRTAFASPYLSQLVPDLGSRHDQMQIQLQRLENFAQEKGNVDCIFLGSSLVWLGVDPDVFETVIAEETGKPLECFNLGIQALPASGAGRLAQYVVTSYQPDLLIYGTSARDYAPEATSEEALVVLDTPWLRFQSGQFSVAGWLHTYSYVFRYAEALTQVLEFSDAVDDLGSSVNDRNGFLPKDRPAQEIHFNAAAAVAEKWFHPYTMKTENLDGLQDVFAMNGPEMQVVIVEMPVPNAYFQYFENGREDYDRFVEQTVRLADQNHIPYIRTSGLEIIPEDGWWDIGHLNQVGAVAFSRWLAQIFLQENLIPRGLAGIVE